MREVKERRKREDEGKNEFKEELKKERKEKKEVWVKGGERGKLGKRKRDKDKDRWRGKKR